MNGYLCCSEVCHASACYLFSMLICLSGVFIRGLGKEAPNQREREEPHWSHLSSCSMPQSIPALSAWLRRYLEPQRWIYYVSRLHWTQQCLRKHASFRRLKVGDAASHSEWVGLVKSHHTPAPCSNQEWLKLRLHPELSRRQEVRSQTTDTSEEDVVSCSFWSKPNTDAKHKHTTCVAHGNCSEAANFAPSHRITGPAVYFHNIQATPRLSRKVKPSPPFCPLILPQVRTDSWPFITRSQRLLCKVRAVISILSVDICLID